ncbi:MAG: hypothetical protein QXW91_02050 [Candidatus Nitrosotenuis sp.]
MQHSWLKERPENIKDQQTKRQPEDGVKNKILPHLFSDFSNYFRLPCTVFVIQDAIITKLF